MATLREFSPEDLSVLLASHLRDATEIQVGDDKGLKPNTHNRTLIIGIGGTGVKTINHIKGVLQKRMHSSWKEVVAFLAIDSSWSEINGAAYLDKHKEGVSITRPGVEGRMANPVSYPPAVGKFMLDSQDAIANLASDGASMTRLIGKIKIHDKEPGKIGVDEEIVRKISQALGTLTPMPPVMDGNTPSTYEVYVIGSGSGGTGSGGFLEIPALVRQATRDKAHRTNIYGILYLPDTLTDLVPAAAGQLKANGYATLKELNYYQGLEMRTDYNEVWAYNNSATPEIAIGRTGRQGEMEAFFDIPYLIGSPGMDGKNASEVSREKIAEFLISLLVESGSVGFVSSAFTSNATSLKAQSDKPTMPANPNKEAKGSAHEFPKCFASLGFAKASAPEQVIRAFAVQKTVEAAGLKPLTEKQLSERSKSAEAKTAILPFRHVDDLENAPDGMARAKQILEEVSKLSGKVNNARFQFIADLQLNPDDVTWENVSSGKFSGTGTEQQIAGYINRATNVQVMDKLRQEVDKLYDAYEKAVIAFVKEHGPYAFVNLFNGRFMPVNGDFGYGIKTMLQNIMEGKTLEGRTLNPLSVSKAQSEVNNTWKAVIDPPKTRVVLVDVVTQSTKTKVTQEWIAAKENLVKAQINQKRRDVVYGETGALAMSFVKKALDLTRDIETFGRVLEALSDVYTKHGSEMENRENFKEATDSLSEINMASLDDRSYNWLRETVEQKLLAVNAREKRDELLDSFFADRAGWLSIPSNVVSVNPVTNAVELVSQDIPVPARQKFDKFITEAMDLNIDVSIYNLFMQSGNGDKQSFYNLAVKMMNDLNIQSQIRFNGNPDGEYMYKYVQYPSVLKNLPSGQEIIDAITDAAGAYGVVPTNVYPSDDTNSVTFYQQATAMEVYRVNDLATWEAEYNIRNTPGTMIHGKSPDVVQVISPKGDVSYAEGQPWRDYPSIVYKENWEERNPVSGKLVYREGELREALRKEIQAAKKMGVLYCEEVPNGYVIKRINCDASRNKPWTFDMMLAIDPSTELAPQGRDLVEAVAAQNDTTVDQMSRVVRLERANLFSVPASSEEYAWEYAERVLRAHHPMMVEIRRTMANYFDKWDAMCREWNSTVMVKYRPSKMVPLLRTGILAKNKMGIWVWNKADRTQKPLANFSDMAIKMLMGPIKKHLQNGLTFYELWQKVDEAMPGDILNDEADRAMELINKWVLAMDMKRFEEHQPTMDVLEAERNALLEKGMTDDKFGEEMSMDFIDAMRSVETDEATLLKIQQFYAKMNQDDM